jgi:ubiquinone/menaquinone biosynthesis C-methylase UbiE
VWPLVSLACIALFWVAVSLSVYQVRHPLTGREIAGVMSVAGADWLERPGRQAEENLDGALDAIGIEQGSTVADVGAGTGYASIRMARRVGPAGKVYANEIQPEMLARLQRNAAAAGLSNIETVLGTETDPKLPRAQIDLITLIDVYHEFSQPQKMLEGIHRALKPDGRLILLEYRKEDPSLPIQRKHEMTVQEAKTEVEAGGFKLSQALENLPRQHILIFTVR